MEPNLNQSTSEQGAAPVEAPVSNLGATPPPQAGSPVDISDDTPIRIPGQAEPVKYGELYKRLQANSTRTNQELAKARKAHEATVAQWQSQRQNEETQLKQLASQLLAARKGGNGDDFAAKLKALPYLDGATAVELVQHLRSQQQPLVQHLNQQNKVIVAMYGQLKQLAEQLSGVSETHQATTFDSKMAQFVKDAGLPPKAADFAKRIYLAYEGDDLDTEFPTILKQEWDNYRDLLREADQEKVAAARNPAFPLKGGATAPLKGKGLTGKENARQTADQLWETLQGSST